MKKAFLFSINLKKIIFTQRTANYDLKFYEMTSRDRASRSFYRVDSNYDLLKFLDRGEAAATQNRWTFEIAWEVANKSKSLEFDKYLLSKIIVNIKYIILCYNRWGMLYNSWQGQPGRIIRFSSEKFAQLLKGIRHWSYKITDTRLRSSFAILISYPSIDPNFFFLFVKLLL